MKSFKLTPLALTLASLGMTATTVYAEQAELQSERTEIIVVTGTRVAGRSVADSASPIDLVSADAISRSGSTELNQVLSTALPSFNFPRPGLTDGTDTVRPATLRGLSPDQTLVLVNSKRRHTASLINVNGTVGRGASAVDLNTIPTTAINSVEVLRDGASAQYGSDAIAGVINVRLREASDGGNLTLSYASRISSYQVPTTPPPEGATWSAPSELKRSRNDGETITLAGWSGFALGEQGFLTLSGEIKDAERTERSGWDYRPQYPLIDGEFDPREQSFDRFNAWYGEPELQQITLFANAGYLLDHGKIYGWASFQDRQARSGGFYRQAADARNVPEIYPDGFLPLIAPKVNDYSAALGYEWDLADWALDASVVVGKNKTHFTIENTLNRSIGPSSKTEFDAGGYSFQQAVVNLSAVRSFEVDAFASPLNLATGLEYRRDNYQIFAGEPDSYRFGGELLPNGIPTAPGAQVFPGFRPSNEVDESRFSIGLYIDLEAELTEQLLASVAIRAEEYSDFGTNLSAKVAARFELTDNFALRGSLQNGFRAPSLQQQFFTTTSTVFISGTPYEITTFPATDEVAVALGAKPLDAENSLNISLGATARLGALNLTLDAYRIEIDDRIVLSENLNQASVREFLTEQGFIDAGGGRFFINGVDTVTQGVDVVANWSTQSHYGQFDFTLAGNINRTEVKRVPESSELAALDPAPTLFGRVNILAFEKGTPSNKISAALNWHYHDFGLTLKANRFGKVTQPQANPANDFTLGAKTLLDIEARYQLTDNWGIAIGADNLLDTYPDPFPIALNTTGATSFSNYSPFGRSGRLLYGRISYDF